MLLHKTRLFLCRLFIFLHACNKGEIDRNSLVLYESFSHRIRYHLVSIKTRSYPLLFSAGQKETYGALTAHAVQALMKEQEGNVYKKHVEVRSCTCHCFHSNLAKNSDTTHYPLCLSNPTPQYYAQKDFETLRTFRKMTLHHLTRGESATMLSRIPCGDSECKSEDAKNQISSRLHFNGFSLLQ